MTFQQRREWAEMQENIKKLLDTTAKLFATIDDLERRLSHIENRSKPGPKVKANG